MKRIFEKIYNFFNNRTLILYIIVIFVSIIYIVQLFNLQILNGSEYREQSEKRMLRTETLTASRGEITDRNGVILATSKSSWNIDLYKVKVEPKEQNKAIATLINILYSNGDKIYSTFPVNDELNGFNFEDEEEEKKWKEEMNLDVSLDFNATIDTYIEKYALEDYANDRNLQIRIIQVKYQGNLHGYSLFNSTTIAKDISEKSVAQISELQSTLYGVDIVSVPKRYYPNGTFLAHVLGYVGNISDTEYDKLKDEGYNINSIIGKSGIEESFEKYLKGKNGVIKAETDTKGNVSSETVVEEDIPGNNVTLTIDYRLQKVSEDALKNTIDGLKNGTLIGKTIPEASAGSVVVLDVNSGEVLAMASYPSYDINAMSSGISAADLKALNSDPLTPMYNRSISGKYSPGSTYKMLVGIAGLKAGGITIDEKILDPGIYPYGLMDM